MIRVIKNSSSKLKNPVYISGIDRLDQIFDKYKNIDTLLNSVVSIYSNNGIIFGILSVKESTLPHEAAERTLVKTTYLLKTNFYEALKPNKDDLGLLFENEDVAYDLFWNNHDEFKREALEKSINFSFILGNVDKVDVKNSKIYVRKLKQFKGKL